MGAIPKNHKLAERQLIELITTGQWEIDHNGYIWRNFVNRGGKLLPCLRRRVEKKLPHGYLMVRAMINGKRVNGLAHRLVWQYHNGDIKPGYEINHRNGIKDDNFLSNLELSTKSENKKHAHKIGIIDQSGQKNPSCKLRDREIAQIRTAYANGDYTMKQLGERFNVAFQTISDIVRGKCRKKQGGQIQTHDLRHNVCDRDPITGRFIGKKKAGCLLDGREYKEYPEKEREKNVFKYSVI